MLTLSACSFDIQVSSMSLSRVITAGDYDVLHPHIGKIDLSVCDVPLSTKDSGVRVISFATVRSLNGKAEEAYRCFKKFKKKRLALLREFLHIGVCKPEIQRFYQIFCLTAMFPVRRLNGKWTSVVLFLDTDKLGRRCIGLHDIENPLPMSAVVAYVQYPEVS